MVLLIHSLVSFSDAKSTEKKYFSINTNGSSIVNRQEDYNLIGSELMKNESLGKLKLGLDSKKIFELLGTPDEKTKLEMWGADGLSHQQLKYRKKGIVIDLVAESDSKLIVDLITLVKPCELKTKKNIGIESSVAEVISAYKKEIDPKNSNKKTIVAGSIYAGIVFTINDQKVESIFIGASAK